MDVLAISDQLDPRPIRRQGSDGQSRGAMVHPAHTVEQVSRRCGARGVPGTGLVERRRGVAQRDRDPAGRQRAGRAEGERQVVPSLHHPIDLDPDDASGRQAIVDDTSGVTRDRQYGTCEWNGKVFNVVDTGGFVEHSDDIFEAAVRSQVKIAIEEASVIVFMVDVTTGITDLDEDHIDAVAEDGRSVRITGEGLDAAG